MDKSDSFEWELSKENIQRLQRGRSVSLLNKVLSKCQSQEFQHKRQQLMQHFELKLASMESCYQKLRLYIRYWRWIEQVYPSAGPSANLENLLYRCLCDSYQLKDVKNDENFVDVWLKLTEFCEQPAEMFELLFRQGVGTMCARFYVAWAEELERMNEYSRAASVYAHGLRAGAKPIFLLEDHAESFADHYKASGIHAGADRGSSATDIFDAPHASASAEPIRQSLAALRLIESRGTGADSNPSLRAPTMRTADMWDPDQGGVGSKNPQNSTRVSGPDPCPRLVFRAPSTSKPTGAPSLLHSLPTLNSENPSSSSVILPAGKPSSWQKENRIKVTPLITNQKTDTLKLNIPTTSVRPIAPQWQMYVDHGETTESQNLVLQEVSPAQPSERSKSNVKSHKRKGLMDTSRHLSGGIGVRHLPMWTLTNLINGDATDPAPPTSSDSRLSDSQELMTHLRLPSLPEKDLPKNAEFAISLKIIYGGAEEVSWEMFRGTCWERVHKPNSESANEQQQQSIRDDDWDEEERKILHDIETVELEPDAPKYPDSEVTTVASSRHSLVKLLETIALGTAQ